MSDDSEPLGPNRLANKCAEALAAIEVELASATTKRETRALRSRRKLLRHMKGWCETRAGYVEPMK